MIRQNNRVRMVDPVNPVEVFGAHARSHSQTVCLVDLHKEMESIISLNLSKDKMRVNEKRTDQ